MDLGSLSWSVEVDTSDLSRAEREMSNTRDAAEGGRRATERMGREAETAGRRTRTATSQMAREFGNVNRSIQRNVTQLTRWGALISGLATGAVALFVRSSMNAIDEQAKLARQLDATIDGLRGLQIAASDAGVSTGAVNSAVERLNMTLGQAMRGAGSAGEALDRLGLSVAEIVGMDADERIAAIADQVQAMGLNGAETADVLRQLGIRQREMVNLMTQGGDAIRAARREVDEFGIALTAIEAGAVEEANDAMARMGRLAEQVRNRIAVELAPTITHVSQHISDRFREASGDMRDGIAMAVEWSLRQFARLIDGAASVVDFISANPMMSQFGIVGFLLLGPKGAALGGIIGGIFDYVARQAERFGIGIDDSSAAAEQLATVMGDLERTEERIGMALARRNQMAIDGASEAAIAQYERSIGLQDEIALYDELVSREQELVALVGDNEDALNQLNRALRLNAGEATGFGEAMRGVADAIRESLENVPEMPEQQRREMQAFVDTIEAAGEESKKTTKEIDELARSYQQLRDRIRPVEASQRRYAQEKATLVAWAMRENMTAAELSALLRDLERDYMNAADAAEEYGFTGARAAEDVKSAWDEIAENTVRRLDTTFQDLWSGMIDGSRNAMDTVKRFFSQMLAEMAHMAITRPIVVSMAGALGVGGSGSAMAGQGGMPSIGGIVGGGNVGGVLSRVPGMGGAAALPNWAFGAAGLGGGLVGSRLGGYGGIGGSLGAAGGMALGSSMAALGSLGGPIGAVAGSVVGGVLGSMFGGSSTPASLRIVTMPHGEMPPGQTGWEHHGQAYERGVFGDVGFAARGTQRLNETLGGQQQEFLQAIVAMDAMLASVASGEEQFNAMAEAVRGVSISGRTGKEVMQRLSERTLAAVRVIDEDYADTLAGLGLSAEELTARAVDAVQTLQSLSRNTERLGLQFDASAAGALSAADALMVMAGGLDNLYQLQSSYYQAFFSEAERAAHLQDDLTQSLATMGMQLPDTRDGFRQLVEAQDLNTESGRETYLALLQLAGGFDQLQTQLESLSGALGGVDLSGVRSAYEQLQSSIAAEQKILRDAHQATTRSIRSNMRTVQESMRDTERLARSLRGAMDTMFGQAAVDQSMRRSGAQLALRGILASGGLGDQGELERALSVVSEPSEDLFGSFEDYQRDFWATASIVDQLNNRASEQLTTEERSLAALERQLDQADRQFEREMARLDRTLEIETAQLEAQFDQLGWLANINGSVMSVEAAVKGLRSAISSATRRQSSGDPIAQAYRDILGRDPDESGYAYYAASGFSDAEIRARLRDSDEANPGRIPGFANGGYHIGGARIVGERGPELEVTGPSRIVSNHDTKKLFDIEPLLREVSELRRELAASQRAIAEHTSKSARVLERDELRKRQEEVV